MSDVPEGYKMSEVGVIPEEWESVKYGDNLNVISGMGFNKSEYVDYGLKLLRIDNVSYGKITWESIAFLPMNYINKHPNLIINSNDILLALNRPITNGKLKIAIVEPKDIPCILYQRVGKIIFISNLYNRKFTYYLLSKFIKKFVEESSVGSDQPFISTTKLKQIEIPLPPLHEQQAIASVLSDTDALITALEQFVTKKHNIKQGAMQQLLTGEKRLPGFEGEWDVKKLGELLDYDQPTKYLVADTEYNDNNDIPVLTAGKTFILGYTNEETGIYRNFPVIIFDDFTTANKYVKYPFKVKSSAMKILKLKDKKVSLKFVFEKMQLIIFQLGDHKRYWISEYQNLEIEVPQPEEQQAIAQILNDMDAEIEALEQKQAKYKAIKQGMMQELLTGKTRLV